MDEFWTIERSLWLDGAEAYRRHMAEDCLMAFAPMGIVRGDAILDSLANAPRWNDVSFEGCETASNDIHRVRGYKAIARREDIGSYTAYCTSTYVVTGGSWKLVQHQQTPLD